MSTPAASESRIRASTVFADGSMMSTRRLWVRISNCSRLSLSMNGERRTQKEVADVAGVTEVTIRNRYRELKKELNLKVTL